MVDFETSVIQKKRRHFSHRSAVKCQAAAWAKTSCVNIETGRAESSWEMGQSRCFIHYYEQETDHIFRA